MRTVIKIGGVAVHNETSAAALLQEAAKYHSNQDAVLIVHGGGAVMTRTSRRLGIEPHFIDGVRITSPEEMEIADMTLAGSVNTKIVRMAVSRGIAAVGITGADGGLLTAEPIYKNNHTSTVKTTNLHILHAVISAGFIPIVASVGIDTQGNAVNINADTAAEALAKAWKAKHLCYISDIAGVKDAQDCIIPRLPTAKIEQLIQKGTVSNGMAAKLRACAAAVHAGIPMVSIGSYQKYGDLQALITGAHGTMVFSDA